ncbi:methyltransferase domain-containing protein [Halococcus agarilyticus]|uniref:methyltransferase domain-containing protein n=1 Tax=Halococcus agarilyticus TaxID=1232219 RepID=UPI000677FBC1|nr:methyltransferase domain-containing protein [Halococcus agarilyticus]
MTRDARLKRWVNQPPASPIVEALRAAERRRALELLGTNDRVLDLASEAGVTEGIDASVTRVDFSPAASEYAEQVLGDAADAFRTADPESPQLPFDAGTFDAAVSIGPYDWKFLAVDDLTEEVDRVLAPDGRFVFSVPTPRSPYAAASWRLNRYYTPAEALSVISPGWRLTDYELVFQYPYYAHMAVSTLPDRYQEPFVDLGERASDVLTARERWDDASYLVLAVEPHQYREHLDGALDCLYRPIDENGFWDESEGKLLRALDYEITGGETGEPTFSWTPDDRELWRYAPFALMGTMQWRTSALATEAYDAKIERALEYVVGRIEGGALDEMPSYGIGPLTCAFALAADVFDDENERIARRLFEHARERFDFTHAEDSLLAYGWSYLYERDPDPEIRDALSDALWTMNDRLVPEGLFAFDNHTTRRHQNQMYACWGFARAAEITGQTGYLDGVERVLDYTIEHRMRDDGAFVWEDVSLPRRVRRGTTKRLGFRPPHWDFLYECHQTFFVNAVAHYYRAGGERDYDRTVRRAMSWIYGDSSRGDLVDLSGVGVPMRFLTVDDRLDVDDQMYKGSYEIGSYVMALSNLLDGPL